VVLYKVDLEFSTLSSQNICGMESPVMNILILFNSCLLWDLGWSWGAGGFRVDALGNFSAGNHWVLAEL